VLSGLPGSSRSCMRARPPPLSSSSAFHQKSTRFWRCVLDILNVHRQTKSFESNPEGGTPNPIEKPLPIC
jgi:hypothetical protein